MSTHNTPFLSVKKKIILNYPKSAAMVFCSKRPKKEFETAVVNEPSVFEPLKFYCILLLSHPKTSPTGGDRKKNHYLSMQRQISITAPAKGGY